MSESYNMLKKQIVCISKYFAKKEEEPQFTHVIKTEEEWNQYKQKAIKINNEKPVFMEYYKKTTPIKPFFDIDVMLPTTSKKKEIKDMDDVVRCSALQIIEEKYKDKNILVFTRPIRKVIKNNETVIKISYRFIVLNCITNVVTLKHFVEDLHQSNPVVGKYFDLNVYREGTNKLCMIGGVKPFNKDKDLKDDPQKPLQWFDEDDSHKYSIFDTAITYIDDDYDNFLDTNTDTNTKKEPTDIEKSISQVIHNDDFANDDTDIKEERKSQYFQNIIKQHFMALSDERAIEYNNWFCCICIIANMAEKYEWSKDTLYDIAHSFSSKGGNSYDYKSVDKKILSALASNTNNKVGYGKLLRMLKEDNPEYYKDEITKSYYEQKQEFEEEFCFINNPVCFYRTPKLPRVITENPSIGDVNQQLTEASLKTLRRNLKYLKKEVDKKGNVSYKKAKFLEEWLDDEKRLTYEGLRFEPAGLSEEESKFYKNLFSGFQADKIELTSEVDYTKIQPILDHIKMVICNNNEEHYTYVMNWFSRIIQDPTNRPQTGLVLYSKEHGVGKNIFTNYFANEILGFELSASVKQVDKIFNRFNSILSKCMFLVVEEACGDIKKYMEDLKNVITEPTLSIEKKHIDAGVYRNYVNVLMNTNREDILDIDDKDRRFVILIVSGIKKGDEEYYNKLMECMKNKQNTALFIKYLREEIKCNWTPGDFQKNRPVTEAYKKQQQLNAKNYIKFFSHILTDKGIVMPNGVKPNSGVEYNWIKYNGNLTVCIKEREIWTAYLKICESHKYISYPYDTFFNYITCKESGIQQIIRHKTKCIKIDQLQITKWVEIFRNTTYNNIEKWDNSNVEEWNEETKRWEKVECEDEFRSDSEDED